MTKAELAPVRRERDKACSSRDAAVWGVATAARERDEARAGKNAAHTKAREARDTARKGWDDLVTLVEEECAAISEERGGMEYKIVESTMTERERWEGRFRAVENRWEAAIKVAVAMGGNTKLARDRYKAQGPTHCDHGG